MDASMATQLIRRRTIQAVGRLNTSKPKETRTQIGTTIGAIERFFLSAICPPAIIRQLYIRTVAGNVVVGYSGDGGAATSALLTTPTGIAFDSSGNIYIADTDNNVIRQLYYP